MEEKSFFFAAVGGSKEEFRFFVVTFRNCFFFLFSFSLSLPLGTATFSDNQGHHEDERSLVRAGRRARARRRPGEGAADGEICFFLRKALVLSIGGASRGIVVEAKNHSSRLFRSRFLMLER